MDIDKKQEFLDNEKEKNEIDRKKILEKKLTVFRFTKTFNNLFFIFYDMHAAGHFLID